MATLHQERFSSGATGDPVPTSTAVAVKLKKDDTTWKSGSTDADGFVSFDLQTTSTLLPGPYYLEITVGAVTKRVHSDVFGVQGRELIGQAQAGQFFVNGVVEGVLDELAVSAPGSGMTVRVATGSFNIKGTVAPVNTLVTLTHDAAHGSLARIDRVIVRLYLDATDYGKVELAILKGTAAASPVVPTLTQSATVWEENLADVSITAALGTITSGNLTDRRTFAGPSVIGSVIQAALDLLAPKANPTFTGTPTFPDGSIAQADVSGLVAALAAKAPAASPVFTGSPLTTGGFTVGADLAVGDDLAVVGDISGANLSISGTVDLPENSLAIADTNGLQTAIDAKAPSANPTFTGLVTTAGRTKSTGTTPSRTIDSNAGSGATCVIEGTDAEGTITFVPGSGPATGAQFTVTFATAKPDANYTLGLWPASTPAARAATKVYAATKAAASWQVLVVDSALAAGTYIWEYAVREREA